MQSSLPTFEVTYAEEDYKAWVSGRRDKWVQDLVPDHVINQPTYHFAEYFVLAHFRALGWNGHRFYALGDWEPKNPKLAAGRVDIERLFPSDKLKAFKDARALVGRSDGKGEPDLFLFHPDGRTMFIEVKKDRDSLAKEQVECLQQIHEILGSHVCVAYLKRSADTAPPR